MPEKPPSKLFKEAPASNREGVTGSKITSGLFVCDSCSVRWPQPFRPIEQNS